MTGPADYLPRADPYRRAYLWVCMVQGGQPRDEHEAWSHWTDAEKYEVAHALAVAFRTNEWSAEKLHGRWRELRRKRGYKPRGADHYNLTTREYAPRGDD